MSDGPQRPGDEAEDAGDTERPPGGPPDDAEPAAAERLDEAGDPTGDWAGDEAVNETEKAAAEPSTQAAESRDDAGDLVADASAHAMERDDEATAAEPETTEAPAPTVVVRRGGGRAIAVIALILVLLLIGTLGGGAGWLVYRGEDPFRYVSVPTIEDLEGRVGELETDLADARRTARQAVDREAELRDGLDDLGRALTGLSADIAAEAPIDERQWRLAETAYLLRVASLRAGVENDRAGAEALLAAADELLREIDDFGLMPVRERIAEARTTLRTAPAVDRTGIYLELEALGKQIAALPMDRREYAPPARNETPPDEQLLEEVQEVSAAWTDSLRETFSALVDFRVHRPSPVRTLPEPGQADYVRHNLALKLEQAQLALLRKDAEVWRIALADAQRWTRDYFDLENPAVQGVLGDLERLAGQRIEIPAPDLSAPLDELLRLRNRASFLGGSRRPAS